MSERPEDAEQAEIRETPPQDDGKQPLDRKNRKRGIVIAVVAVAAAAAGLGIHGGWLPLPAGLGISSEEQAPNAFPILLELTADTDRITPLSPTGVSCAASDPDGDPLTYTWSASEGEISGEGWTIVWTPPDTEGLFRVFVTVDDGRGGSIQESIALSVRSNQPPEILVMQSEAGGDDGWVVPGASVYVRTEANDPDGDELTYAWSSTGGRTYGQGTAVIWSAPATLGTYWIALEVEDTYGAHAERSVPVTVNAAQPPAMHGFHVQALDTNLFRPYGDSWRIFKERSCSIEARVDDPDGVYTYSWEAEAGSITADGPKAVWVAPASPKGWVNIVLVVSDSHGNKASDAIRIYVETCTSCM